MDIILGVIVVILILAMFLVRETWVFRVTDYVYRTPKVEESFKVAVLADLHGKVYSGDNEKLYRAIAKASPDVVICAGDMITARWDAKFTGYFNDEEFFSENKGYQEMIRLLAKLTKICPVYFGNGNHESRLYRRREKFGSAYEEFCLTLRHIGVHLLSNKHEEILVNDTPVCIYGLDIERDYYKRVEKIVMDPAYVTSKLGKAEDNNPGINLLIAHNPEYFEAYTAWGADLTFSGHLHGGMVRIPGIGGLLSPQLRFFPKYSGGIYYDKKGRAEIVSKGIGAHGIDIRVFNRAEIVMVNIERQKYGNSREAAGL